MRRGNDFLAERANDGLLFRMRIYLDMCCLQRPMDDQAHFRIHMETEAILGVLAWCEAGNAQLLSSVALRYEIDHNPHPVRKAFAQETLSKSAVSIPASSAAAQRARRYAASGIKALDALHLACAVEANADYFCTCDDRFLRRAKLASTATTRAVSPSELIEILDP